MAIDKKDNKSKTRDHADFQDSYRRSSNFDGVNDNETEKIKIIGDGEVALKKGDEEQSDKEKIKDALNKLSKDEEE